MNDQPKDSSLDTPGEANRGKHINFLALEEENDDRAAGGQLFASGKEEDGPDVNRDDMNENDTDRLAGSDRAGTAERKDNRIDE
ncbi:MAG TPA: hypothetical protein VHK69_10785 [Chitinophagaceae bacterium]|jgi:hypothetical protein|nr:hypothetical protein [Chitinophagaceae bacterium]